MKFAVSLDIDRKRFADIDPQKTGPQLLADWIELLVAGPGAQNTLTPIEQRHFNSLMENLRAPDITEDHALELTSIQYAMIVGQLIRAVLPAQFNKFYLLLCEKFQVEL